MDASRSALDILAGLALFADLGRPQLEAVTHAFDEAWFNPPQRILRRGFEGSNFHVILDGEATVAIDGEEVGRLGRGDFFGEISVLLDEPPTADVVATSPLRCLVMAGAHLPDFLLAHPTVMLRMLRTEAMRLAAASYRRRSA